MISFKWGSLFGALSVDSKQRISFGSSSVVYGILLLRQGCCSFNQYNLQDMILRLNFNPTLQMWIMPCVSKPTCTNVIIISLWLICHIQCGFSISYLSISGIAAHDRCNISTFLPFFSFNVVLCLLLLFWSVLSSILYVNVCVSVSCSLIFFLCYRINNNSPIHCQLFWPTSFLWQQLSLQFFL